MNSLTRWNPAGALSLRDAMNRLFEDSFVWSMPDLLGGSTFARLPVDVYTTDNDVVVKVAIPGVKPEDVEVTFEGDTLTIKGQIPPREEGVTYLFAETFRGSFARSLRLDIPVDADRIEATFDNGLLTLTLPKAEAVKPRTIKVKAR